MTKTDKRDLVSLAVKWLLEDSNLSCDGRYIGFFDDIQIPNIDSELNKTQTNEVLNRLLFMSPPNENDARKLREMASNEIAAGRPVPAFMRDFIASVLSPAPRKRGRNPQANLLRDLAICSAIGKLEAQFGLRPTRNEVSQNECGCSVVADALAIIAERNQDPRLELSEAAVAKLWQGRVFR